MKVKNIGLFIILLLGLLPLLDLFHPGLPQTHDGQDHVARIANFYASLNDGNIIPRWAGNLNWGYGHPILMFLYPLPSYIASFFHFLGFSFVDSVKLVFGLTYIASGLAMYLWIKNMWGEKAGIVSSVIYLYLPYRFVDLYVRGAIGEHTAFVFIPLVFYFLLKISKIKDQVLSIYSLGLSLSSAGLLLSHNAISIMVFPVALMYSILLISKSKHKLLLAINYLLFTILGFGLSAFFLIPAFFEGKYTLRDIVTGHGEYKSAFVNFTEFILPSWSYGGSVHLSKQIGIAGLIGVMGSVIFELFSKKKLELKIFILFFSFFLLSLFLMTNVSSFIWERVSLIQKFQFPWRFLSLTVFTSSVLCAMPLLYFKKEVVKKIYCTTIVLLAVVLSFSYFHAQSFLQKPESFYTGVYKSTTDTGESSPIWSVRFMEHTTSFPAEFIDGQGTIERTSYTTTTRSYKINVTGSNGRIRENTLYFPNWEVFVNGKEVPVEFQDRLNRGLITYNLKKGNNSVFVKFSDTKLRQVSNSASLISVIILVIMLVSLAKRKKQNA